MLRSRRRRSVGDAASGCSRNVYERLGNLSGLDVPDYHRIVERLRCHDHPRYGPRDDAELPAPYEPKLARAAWQIATWPPACCAARPGDPLPRNRVPPPLPGYSHTRNSGAADITANAPSVWRNRGTKDFVAATKPIFDLAPITVVIECDRFRGKKHSLNIR